jgi:hypothetical protein
VRFGKYGYDDRYRKLMSNKIRYTSEFLAD